MQNIQNGRALVETKPNQNSLTAICVSAIKKKDLLTRDNGHENYCLNNTNTFAMTRNIYSCYQDFVVEFQARTTIA